MTEAYDVKKGDYVFVHTVAGGLGLLFAQIAKHRGAIVIGTTSTQEKASIAKQHGADHVILYPTENTVERVLEITKGEGVHVIYDGVGKDTYAVQISVGQNVVLMTLIQVRGQLQVYSEEGHHCLRRERVRGGATLPTLEASGEES